jgi:hypothetical protein
VVQISKKPAQSGSQDSEFASVKPVKNNRESPGKMEVKMKAVSMKITKATATAAQSPKASIIACASNQFKFHRSYELQQKKLP